MNSCLAVTNHCSEACFTYSLHTDLSSLNCYYTVTSADVNACYMVLLVNVNGLQAHSQTINKRFY